MIWSDAGKCFQCPGNEILETASFEFDSCLLLFLPEVVRLPTEEVCAAQVVRAVRVVEAAGDLVLGQADA